MTIRLQALAVLTATLLLATAASAQQQKTTISLETAKVMAGACEALAAKEGWRMVTVIVDDGANMKLFSRMDNAYLASVQIAQLKASTSAGFPFSSRQVGEIAQQRVPGIVHVPGIVTFAGGLPIITAKGEHLGGIGVSGAKADQDELCAQAALDAVKDQLGLR